MYCPKCSQEQISENVRFCSRCGFLLTGIAEVVANDGIVAGSTDRRKRLRSKFRKKGVRQGIFILVLNLLFSPILLTFIKISEMPPVIFFLTVFIFFVLGIIRIAYSLLFEIETESSSDKNTEVQKTFPSINKTEALPAAETNLISDFVPPVKGTWRDSKDLIYSSITDVTTRQLDKK